MKRRGKIYAGPVVDVLEAAAEDKEGETPAILDLGYVLAVGHHYRLTETTCSY